MAQVVQDQRVDHRVRLVHLVVGLGETKPHRVAGEPLQDGAVHLLFEPRRRFEFATQRVGRFSKHVFGHEVVTPAHRDVHTFRVVHRIHRDVATRVACTHNQHAFALEQLGTFVG